MEGEVLPAGVGVRAQELLVNPVLSPPRLELWLSGLGVRAHAEVRPRKEDGVGVRVVVLLLLPPLPSLGARAKVSQRPLPSQKRRKQATALRWGEGRRGAVQEPLSGLADG